MTTTKKDLFKIIKNFWFYTDDEYYPEDWNGNYNLYMNNYYTLEQFALYLNVCKK
jgi:hypothetical protein